MDYNKAQMEAIQSIHGPVMAVACPGSGKTTMVIERTCEMLRRGIDPFSIVVMTFTKAAAEEMQIRFQKKSDIDGVRFGTIHSVCLDILKAECPYSISVLTGYEQWRFFKSQCQAEEDQNEYIKSLINEISVVRNNGIKVSAYEPESCDKIEFIRIYKAYQTFKTENNKLDFDDILVKVDQLFRLNPDILEKWQEIFRYITVDEYQDSNLLQADIIYMLARKYQNLCVVGDDDQSIYQFRGAKPAIMLNFVKEFPDAKRIDMGTNYRSEPVIVETAAKLIQKNENRFKKEIQASKNGSGTITKKPFISETAGINYIVSEIGKLNQSGVPYSEMAILYRTNSENINLAMELINKKIPYTCTEEINGLHDHFTFKDIRTFWKIAQGTAKRSDYCRVINRPNRFISTRNLPQTFTADELKKILLENASKYPEVWKRRRQKEEINNFFAMIHLLKTKQTPKDFVNTLFVWGYDTFLKEYKKKHKSETALVDGMIKRIKDSLDVCDNMPDWFAAIETNDQILRQNTQKKGDDCVTLSTLHGAKGLEWQDVFIINVNQGTIPFTFQGECDLEEERRLFYVGITRAKTNLYLISDALKDASQFLQEM